VTSPRKQKTIGLLRKNRATARLLSISSLLKPQSYLKKAGWYRSSEERQAVDGDGGAVPWYTYSAIAFLEGKVDPAMSVFEYGSGNSTIWWSRRVANVVSCEHDREWFESTKQKLLANVEYLHFELSPAGSYSRAILEYPGAFDIVVIDGRDRVNCVKNALVSLKPNGVIVWDNSDRERYQEGYDHLLNRGFKRLDFSGMGPINANGWTTSIFYRQDNCLGI
jgi:hypothetical protein